MRSIVFGFMVLATAACGSKGGGDAKSTDEGSSSAPAAPTAHAPAGHAGRPGHLECRALANTDALKAPATLAYGDSWLGDSADAATAATRCQTLCGAGWRLPERDELAELHHSGEARKVVFHPDMVFADGGKATTFERFWVQTKAEAGVPKYAVTIDDALELVKPGEPRDVLCTTGLSRLPLPPRPASCDLPEHVDQLAITAPMGKAADWEAVRENQPFHDPKLRSEDQTIESLKTRDDVTRLSVTFETQRAPFDLDGFVVGTHPVTYFGSGGIQAYISNRNRYHSDSGTFVLEALDTTAGTLAGHFENLVLREERDHACTITFGRLDIKTTMSTSPF